MELAALVAAVGAIALTAALTLPAGHSTAPPAPVPAPFSAQPSSAAVTPIRATALRIPALELDSDLVELGVDADGVLVPPASPDVAGWFTGGAVPGERGPAVIAGHLDSRTGPGVFARLADVPVGAEVEVDRSDGSTARFRVVAVTVVGKDEFPTRQVYGPTPVAALSLITCGGQFDRATRHYRDNVVVSAVPLG